MRSFATSSATGLTFAMRFMRLEGYQRDGERTMDKLDDTPSPDDSVAVPLECKAGSLGASTTCRRTIARRTGQRSRGIRSRCM